MALLRRSKRLKLMNSALSTPTSGPDQWLDLLPPDLCVHIASYLSRGEFSDSLRALAEVSPIQCSALLAALRNRLPLSIEIFSQYDCDVIRWSQIATPSIVELTFVVDDLLSLYSNRNAREETEVMRNSRQSVSRLLATAPNLRGANLPSDPALLSGLSQATRLKELTVRLAAKCDTAPWIAALSSDSISLSISRLSLMCPLCEGCFCPSPSAARTLSTAIIKSCPSLSILEIDCYCSTADSPSHNYSFLNRINGLRGTLVRGKVPPRAFAKLRDMDAVRIQNSKFSYTQAVTLGPSVTELLGSGPDALDSEQVSALACCTQMKKLCIAIKGGAEVALAAVVTKMSKLRVLRVFTDNPEECGHIGWDGEEFFGDHQICLHDVAEGVYLAIVKAAPNLLGLHLPNVRIGVGELIGMLESIGERLVAFSTSICGQDQEPSLRLTELLLAAIKYNPKLKSFDAASRIDGGEFAASPEIRRDRGRELMAILRRVTQRSPFFNCSPLESVIEEYLLQDDYDEEEDEEDFAWF